ncbi:MAG: DUF1573 domain-containing protein [Bacteroidales bacterium]
MKYYKSITICILLLIITIFVGSCLKDNQQYLNYVLEGISFKEALDKAKKEDKLLWVVIGDSYDTKHSLQFLNILSRKGVFKKYSNKYVFYACNIVENEQYYFVLRPSSIPNSYIFNNNGGLISSYAFSEDQIKFAVDQLEQFSDDDRVKNCNDDEYLLQNIAIKAANYLYTDRSNDSIFKAKALIDYIFDEDLNYFTAYLKTKISLYLNDSITTRKYADIAFEKYNSDPNPLLFSRLNEEIKEFSEKYKQEKATKPFIKFEKQTIDCGKVKKGKEFIIKVKYRNEGASPLIIYQTIVSCSCVKAELSNKAVPPGTSSEISFKYDPSTKGAFSRSVYFQTNASNRFEKIQIEGEVI